MAYQQHNYDTKINKHSDLEKDKLAILVLAFKLSHSHAKQSPG